MRKTPSIKWSAEEQTETISVRDKRDAEVNSTNMLWLQLKKLCAGGQGLKENAQQKGPLKSLANTFG